MSPFEPRKVGVHGNGVDNDFKRSRPLGGCEKNKKRIKYRQWSQRAKGRVERANGTLQDRLIKELRERGISSIEEGNNFLDEYTKMHNKRFSVERVAISCQLGPRECFSQTRKGRAENQWFKPTSVYTQTN